MSFLSARLDWIAVSAVSSVLSFSVIMEHLLELPAGGASRRVQTTLAYGQSRRDI
jgi:hypothetical protein